MDNGVGQIKKPPCKISSWPGPSSWCYRKYQADLVNSAQRETASSCQSISTHRASPAIAKRNSNHPRSHFFIPGNRWSIINMRRCSHVQYAWKSVTLQNIDLFCSGKNWLCLPAGIKRQPFKRQCSGHPFFLQLNLFWKLMMFVLIIHCKSRREALYLVIKFRWLYFPHKTHFQQTSSAQCPISIFLSGGRGAGRACKPGITMIAWGCGES